MPYVDMLEALPLPFRYTVVVLASFATAAMVTDTGSTPVPVVCTVQALVLLAEVVERYAVTVPDVDDPAIPRMAQVPAANDTEFRL
jgi:hypothetical protein